MDTKREYKRVKGSGRIVCESSGDYTLPDYNGDVRKLLYTSARVCPGGSFMSGEQVEAIGSVEYTVVYLDGEGEISNTSFTTDYETTYPCSADSFSDMSVAVELGSFNVRLVGPRRFSARASLDCCVKIIESACVEIEGDSFTVASPECASTSVEVRQEEIYRTDEKTVKSELWRGEGCAVDDVTVLIKDSCAVIENIKDNGDGLAVKGAIKLRALIKCADEIPTLAETVLPFDESVELENNKEGRAIYARVNVSVPKMEVSAEDFGTVISAEVSYCVNTSVCYNDSVEVIKDCFLADSMTENEYGEFKYDRLIGAEWKRVTVSGELPKGDVSDAEFRNVIYPSAEAHIDEISARGRDVEIAGKIRFSGIACQVLEDGKVEYVGVSPEIRFCENVNIGRQIPEEARFECSVICSDAVITVDELNIYPSVNLSFAVGVYCEERQGCLRSSVITDVSVDKDPSVVTVYYPTDTDTLFDVAKKYHVPILKLASDNSLAESCLASVDSTSSLVGATRLIIKG